MVSTRRSAFKHDSKTGSLKSTRQAKNTTRSTRPTPPSTKTVTDHDDDQESSQESDHDDQNDTSESASENESSAEESSDEESESDSDLDDLLAKAQTSLETKQSDAILLDSALAPSDYSLPKLDPGVDVDRQLYLQAKDNGMVKMAGDAVQFKDTNDKDTKNALVTLQAAQEAPKSLSRKERQQERQKTSGGGWFDMPLGEMTEENKRDLQILRMRHVLDRKRHYRKMDKKHQPKYFQIGTLVESPTEFFSARLNRKDRKQTLAEEIMGDAVHTDYYKRKYSEIQEAKTSGGKRHHKKKLAKRR